MSPNHLPWFGTYILCACVHVRMGMCTYVPVNRYTILPKCIGDNQVSGNCACVFVCVYMYVCVCVYEYMYVCVHVCKLAFVYDTVHIHVSIHHVSEEVQQGDPL